jgi:hypothetical protein
MAEPKVTAWLSAIAGVAAAGVAAAGLFLTHSSSPQPNPAPTFSSTAPVAATSLAAPAKVIVNNGGAITTAPATARSFPAAGTGPPSLSGPSTTPVAAGPVITGVTFSGDTATPTVTIVGTGFRTAPPPGQSDNATSCGDYTSNGDVYGLNGLWFTDVNNFTAGQSSSSGPACIGIIIQSWSANQVVYQFGNAYNTFAHWYLTAGDQYELSVDGGQYSGKVAFT